MQMARYANCRGQIGGRTQLTLAWGYAQGPKSGEHIKTQGEVLISVPHCKLALYPVKRSPKA